MMQNTYDDSERMQELSHVTFEQAKDGFFWIDAEGRIYRVNAAACQALGYSREELLTMRAYDFDKPMEEFAGTWKKAKEKGRIIIERDFHRKDGSIYPVEILMNMIELRGVEYCAVIVHDITERKAREEALHKAMEELEQLKSRLEAENVYLQEEIKVDHNFAEIVGQSQVFKKVLTQIEQVAPTDATVLILGETGTGKELLARAVHDLSFRKERPLVKVNCAALPANLIESELFGHEKGAFTGAVSRKIGRFELANGGTIFLDEIGDLPLELQAKLLRVLQEGEFERLGDSRTQKVDVRVIAATNRDLEQAMAGKSFREDLYYRLNVFPVSSPPLRERKEDVPALVRHFVQKYAPRMGKKIESISQGVMDTLISYHWPGNIRELENIIERSLILSRGKDLELGDFNLVPKAVSGGARTASETPETLPEEARVTEEDSATGTLEEVERDYILKVLEQAGWRVSGERGAAKILGLNPSTLDSRMRKLKIKRKSG